MQRFVTSIQCMDGNFYWDLHQYILKCEGAVFVDTITLAAPCDSIIAGCGLPTMSKRMVSLSLNNHMSTAVYLSAHENCLSAPSRDKDSTLASLKTALQILSESFNKLTMYGLYIDQSGSVQQVAVYHPSLGEISDVRRQA